MLYLLADHFVPPMQPAKPVLYVFQEDSFRDFFINQWLITNDA